MSEFDFSGRTVVITGAGGGIGRAHALLFGSLGANVVVNDLGGDLHGEGAGGAAEHVVQEIRAAGGVAVASTDSVATPEGGSALVDAAISAYGKIDAVVHNAGILRDRSLPNLSPDDVASVLAVHLTGAFNVLRPAYPHMREQGYGRIVLTSSASGLFGNFGQTNYGAAKAGLVGLMNVLALEGARHGILVNVVSPTAATRMTEDMLGDLGDRFDPAHVSPVVAYLCSERCSLTHHIFSVGGGRVARIFLAVTPGIYFGRKPATPAEIERRLDEILDIEGFVIPDGGADEVALIQRVLADE